MPTRLINLLKRILRGQNPLLVIAIVIAIALSSSDFNLPNSNSFLPQSNTQNTFHNERILQGKVLRVIDGDTIELLAKDLTQSSKVKIRLFGIDAPESKQAYGKEAKFYLNSLILNKEVKVLIESKDRYQRLIGTIYLNDKDINKEMVKNGYAWAYEEYSTKYLTEQADAKMFKLGLWQDENVISPSEFRKQQRKG